MTTTARFAPGLLYGALAFILKQPHAVTREKLTEHMKRSDVIVSRVLSHLKTEGLVKVAFCVDARRVRAAVYYFAKAALIPPPGYQLSVHGHALPKAVERRRAVRLEAKEPTPVMDPITAALFGKMKEAA